MALQLIASLGGPWALSRTTTPPQEKVRELVAAKAAGQEIAAAEEPSQATNVFDLMQVLQGSIEQARGGRVGGGEPRQKKRVPARKVAWKPAAKDAKKTAAKKAPPKKARATSASGSRHGAGRSELRQLSKAELYERATEQDIPGGPKMSLEELVDALARVGRHRQKRAT